MKKSLQFLYNHKTKIKHVVLIPLFIWVGVKASVFITENGLVEFWQKLSECEKEVLDIEQLWIQTLLALSVPMFLLMAFKLYLLSVGNSLDKLTSSLWDKYDLLKEDLNPSKVLLFIPKVLYYIVANPVNFLVATGASMGGMFLWLGRNYEDNYYFLIFIPIIIIVTALILESAIKDQNIPTDKPFRLKVASYSAIVLAVLCWLYTSFYLKFKPFIEVGAKFLKQLSS